MPHIHEKVDFVVDVFIVNKNRVLLRRHDKYKIWLAPGGHIEPDEDPNQAALREVKEEVGLDITLLKPSAISDFKDSQELIPPYFVNRHRINDNHEHVSFIYLAVSDSDEVQQGADEISDDIRWFAEEDLDNPELDISERINKYAKMALVEAGNNA